MFRWPRTGHPRRYFSRFGFFGFVIFKGNPVVLSISQISNNDQALTQLVRKYLRPSEVSKLKFIFHKFFVYQKRAVQNAVSSFYVFFVSWKLTQFWWEKTFKNAISFVLAFFNLSFLKETCVFVEFQDT